MMASDRDQLMENRENARQAERDIHLPNPISLFDHHLRVLDQSYIQFFQDRIRIEEQYIASLSQLYQRTRYIDSQLDNNVETTSLRHAWREARDCVDREAEARGAFVSALRNDVVNPLVALRESNERTKKRIKEDIKDSYQGHIDYQENTLPRLKQKYLKKVQDVEEYKGMERQTAVQNAGFAPIPQGMNQPSSTSPTSSHFPPNGAFNATQGSPPRAPLPSPMPQAPPTANPLVQQNSRASSQPPVPRNRSPSATSSLSDLAQQSKKAIKGFLQDGGPTRNLNSMRDGFGDRGSAALRGVKAKRDADEADKEYRKGVHWLETLRLRRSTIIRSGYTSLEDFIWEQGLILKKVLQKYVDDLLGTAHTSSQLASHIQESVSKISLERDRDIQTQHFSNIDQALKHALPPTLYYNYALGECKDLIFGTGLVNYATTHGMTGEPGVALGLARGGKMAGKDGSGAGDKGNKIVAIGQAQATVPRLVQLCIRDIDTRGLATEGIYRVSGRFANVQELRHLVEKDESSFEINPQVDDVYCVSSLLKLYLRELPEPVFRFPLAERLQYTEDRDEHIANKFTVLRNKMRRLPPVHQATLRLVVEHLARIAANQSQNKMDPKNLSIVFGTLLFGEDEIPKGMDVLTLAHGKDTVLEDLITYSSVLFDEGPSSPPLPAAPLEEPAAIDYGSSHTKVHRKPPQQDFTPSMPSQPDYSIHPSAKRAQGASSPPPLRAAMSPTKVALPLGGVDLGSPSDEMPPVPPPASEKKRFEGMDLRSDPGHGDSPRRSLNLLREEGTASPRRSLESREGAA